VVVVVVAVVVVAAVVVIFFVGSGCRLDFCGGSFYLVFSYFLFFHPPILVQSERFLTHPLPVFY
jgi:glucose dehydrogenase